MRQRREPVRVGDAGARDRPVVRRHQVLRRPLEGADEGGRDPVRPRLDEDGIGPEVHAVGNRRRASSGRCRGARRVRRRSRSRSARAHRSCAARPCRSRTGRPSSRGGRRRGRRTPRRPGKLWSTATPPRLPYGVPSTCSACEVQRDTRKVASLGVTSGSPIASRLISLAARRYPSISVGESNWTSAMLSKFALFVSSGR